MDNIKINNKILVVRLTNGDIMLCKLRTNEAGGVNLTKVDDILNNKEYDLQKDAEKFCVIIKFSCLKKLFNKELDKEGINELSLLLQDKKYQKILDDICQKAENSTLTISLKDPLNDYKEDDYKE